MVGEASLEQTESGLVATGEGWYVLNAREGRWYHAEGRPALCDLEGDQSFPQLGINIQVLHPGDAMAMYHWEADQEDFLVVSGEGLLIVELRAGSASLEDRYLELTGDHDVEVDR